MQLLYVPISKVEETADGLIVEGIASTETVDEENDVVDYDSLKAVLPDYEQWMTIREMHQPIAAGRALVVTPDDAQRTLFLRALVVDSESQKKVRAGVLKAFSIGGKGRREIQKRDDGSTYARAYVKKLSEISLVDRPANPDARFTLIKMEAAMAVLDTEDELPDPIADVRKLAGSETIKKAAADPAKIVSLIQASRNDLELAGDMEGAALLTQAIALVQQASGEAEEAPAEAALEPTDEAADDPALAMAAKPGNLRKAGRTFSGGNISAMHNVVKTLLQLMAGAGDAIAQKAMSAYAGDSGEGDIAMASKVAAAILPQFETLAKGLLIIHDRLSTVEAQPVPGGPVIRSVQKVIAGQAPAATTVTKPAAPGYIRESLEDLLRKANTAASPAQRDQLLKQHDRLREQYA